MPLMVGEVGAARAGWLESLHGEPCKPSSLALPPSPLPRYSVPPSLALEMSEGLLPAEDKVKEVGLRHGTR